MKNWKKVRFNDFIIKVEDEGIEANRMVLASRSLYFEKMFKTEMKNINLLWNLRYQWNDCETSH